jgi:putative flippase GtrA
MKFNAVGAIGICVQLGVLSLLTSAWGLNYLVATALAVEAAVLHNFFWHERFTWADRPARSTAQRLWKFNVTTGACSLAGNLVFTKLLVNAGLSYLPANAGSIAICSIANFLINDRMVFIKPATKVSTLSVEPQVRSTSA